MAVATGTRGAFQVLDDVGQDLDREGDGTDAGRRLRSLVEKPTVLHLGLSPLDQDHPPGGVDIAAAQSTFAGLRRRPVWSRSLATVIDLIRMRTNLKARVRLCPIRA